MELTIVEHDEAGIADEIRPHVVVKGRVAHLVDDQIVRLAAMVPDESRARRKVASVDQEQRTPMVGRRRTHRSRGKPRWPAAARGCTEQCRI